MPKLTPTYDPDWGPRFDRALAQANASNDSEDVAAMHRAFWAQFRTMAEIRDFHFDSLRKSAEVRNLELVLPELDDDCTWEEIAEAYGHGDNAINEYMAEGYRSPYAHPSNLDAFHDDDVDAQRFTDRYNYVGFWNTPSACILTIEYQENTAYVCFTLIENAGTSPINMMEELATIVYHERLADRYKHSDVHWYSYFRFRGFTGHEGFMEAILNWDRKRRRYADVSWNHFPSVPRIIGETANLA